MATSYMIQFDNGDFWQNWQSLNATNDRAAGRCYADWLTSVTDNGARDRFRLVKIFVNAGSAVSSESIA